MRKHDLGQWVAEDYVTAIATLEASGRVVIGARLAEFFGVTPPTVTEIVHRLQNRGLVTLGAAKELGLTEPGRELAERTLRRRRLAERFFVEVLGLSLVEAELEADRLEHAISDEVADRLGLALGDPEVIGAGLPIVPHGVSVSPPTLPLNQAQIGEDLVLERMCFTTRPDEALTMELTELGLVPGSRLTILAAQDSVLTIRTPNGETAISARAAQALAVRPAQPPRESDGEDPADPPFHLKVKAVQGTCLAGHREGEDFALGHCAPAGVCLNALQRVIPVLNALRLAGDGAGPVQVPCPEDGIVTFVIERAVSRGETARRDDSHPLPLNRARNLAP